MRMISKYYFRFSSAGGREGKADMYLISKNSKMR
jgi:hypothetical protein